MREKIIENLPRIAQFIGNESYLTPYIGSLYCALHAFHAPRPYSELLALSGAGNRLCWRAGRWDGGSVDILAYEQPQFAPHLRVLRALGLTAEIRLCRELLGFSGPYVGRERAKEEIVESIDRGVPVIAMGMIGPPECCAVFGYKDGGNTLCGWNYFQGDEGFDPEKPFEKEDWFGGLYGYLLLGPGEAPPPERESALEVFRAITRHARGDEVRGAKVGFSAWEAMLYQIEHDDFAGLPLLLPKDPWDGDVWQSTMQGRFFTYCDSLCQIHERGVALPYYQSLAERFPEWREDLTAAVAAWRECSSYGGFLWQHLTMDAAGYEKFRGPAIRKILADEGYRSMRKDIEAVESIEKLLAAR